MIQDKRLSQAQTQVITKSVTVELANGDLVHIDKWIRDKITGESLDSRQVTAYEIEFGFTQAWSVRLIVGRHTVNLFGFKDSHRQWVDARRGPTMVEKQCQAAEPQKEGEHVRGGVPMVAEQHHDTTPESVTQVVTVMDTTYVGKHT